VRTT